jgi:predicted nuclease with RNAse H fold
MPLIEPVFLGIDPTSGKKSFTYAVLDKDLRLLALTDGEAEDVLAFVESQPSTVVAINAPSDLNRGLVEKKLKKEMTAPHQVRGAQMRLCEYELRKHGISVSGTPSHMTSCPSWMQLGFGLYRKLEKMGFSTYPDLDAPHQLMETHPHACYCILAETVPQSKPSLEGRLQRQLLLYERGVRIRDSMDFFEEITRHKMMKGIWPVELLYLPEELDALAAAYTAWLAYRKPEQVSLIGDKKEGQIVLPEKELKENY